MYIVYALVRFYPFWGLILALTLFELGRAFRRKGSPLGYPCLGMGVSLMALVGCWIYFRGDVHSDQWVKMFFRV